MALTCGGGGGGDEDGGGGGGEDDEDGEDEEDDEGLSAGGGAVVSLFFYTFAFVMRGLSIEEIALLRRQGCWAEDFGAISVAEGFAAEQLRDVLFYGRVSIGATEKMVDCGGGVQRQSGIRRAVLRDVSIGDNCLIDNIGCHLSGYVVGAESVIINVGTIEATADGTFGVGATIHVLAEAGEGNIVLTDALTSPVAALLARQGDDCQSAAALRRLLVCAAEGVERIAMIGCRCRIVNTQRLTNVFLGDDCEVDGALVLSDSSINSTAAAAVYIGAGVQVTNSIVAAGASLLSGAVVDSCFVGSSCCLRDGFVAHESLFFEGCQMAAGEAAAAFCGPLTVSHHRGTLLIGSAFSFFNAGAGTTMANHAYKMGPVHSAVFARGSKTGTASYLSLPAQIAPFSVCLGRIVSHPDARFLPFSYLFGTDEQTTAPQVLQYSSNTPLALLVPGRGLVSAGLWRDIHKWQRRYRRSTASSQRALLNLDWLSPYVVDAIVAGCTVLAYLRSSSPTDEAVYHYQGCAIKVSSLEKGLRYYDMALHLFMGAALEQQDGDSPTTDIGVGSWTDLGGLLLPVEEEQRVLSAVRNGDIASLAMLHDALRDIADNYRDYCWAYAYHLILKYYHADSLTAELREQIRDDYAMARHDWLSALRRDAEKEYALGDVPAAVLSSFLDSLDDNEE